MRALIEVTYKATLLPKHTCLLTEVGDDPLFGFFSGKAHHDESAGFKLADERKADRYLDNPGVKANEFHKKPPLGLLVSLSEFWRLLMSKISCEIFKNVVDGA